MRILVAVVLLVCSGCTQYIKQVDSGTLVSKLPFLQDGVTSHDEVISRLGEPKELYETGRIIIYEACEDKEGQLFFLKNGVNGWPGKCTERWSPIFLTLVLVFHEDGILKKHSLVRR